MQHNSRHPNDRYKGQRYNTYTAHRTGQPYGGLGPWLYHNQERVNADRNRTR